MPFRTRHPKHPFAAALAAGVVGVFTALPVLAQVDLGLEPVAEGSGLATGDIRMQIAGIIRVFFGLLGIIAVGLILYAGWLWMTAQGDAGKVDTAKGVLKNAVIGLVIILSAYAIATFVLNAITGSSGGISGSGCPPGQICGGGSIGGGGSGAVRVTGITPVGRGPGNAGWPKNYSITIGFTSEIKQSTATNGTNVRVQRCNPRINGSGEVQAFRFSDCTAAISGTPVVDGRLLRFKPDASSEDEPTDFEGDYWYLVTLRNGPTGLRDVTDRVLACPTPLAGGVDGYGSSDMPSDSCIRAMAFNDLRDVEPPTVRIISPSSPPQSCGVPPLLPVYISAEDDFLVADVEVLLNGASAGLVDATGAPFASTPVSVNADVKDPFISSDIYIDTASLTPGESYTISAVAHDGVPQASTPATKTLVMAPAHCCNDVQDDADGETGVDCGPVASGCGFCAGSTCSADSDCQSGYCDPATNTCVERPIIMGVSGWNGGPGTLITLTGVQFGSGGNVVFLGNPADPADDKTAQACAPGAWTATQVTVSVPIGAVDGPLRLVANDGRYDDTTADSPPGVEGSFDENGVTKPGICYLEPSGGPAGDEFTAHGVGFGASVGTGATASFGQMGTTVMGIEAWAETAVRFLVPAVRDGAYPVRMWIGGPTVESTNDLSFAVRPGAGDANPVITAITPVSGPVGQYVTLTGSGFGNQKGVVRFFDGPIAGTPEIAVADEPICDDSWHDNYVVVKVPKEYQAGLASGVVNPVGLKTHLVRIETAAPSKISNTVDFLVNTAPLTPGLCSMSPLNGPPSTLVTLEGEGFGAEGPNTGSPRYTVDFYNGNDPAAPGTVLWMMAETYAGWSSAEVTARVPGNPLDQASWPKSGPVAVTARNVQSANTIPFQVVNCNDVPTACGAGTQCCTDGVCRGAPNWCGPPALANAYGFVLSTETLPALPQVVERSQCSADQLQSPSPAKDSKDACRNALVTVEISREIDPLTVGSETFAIIACGTGTTADCSTGAALTGVTYAVGSNGNGGSILFATPATGLVRNTWYRVTLVSDPAAVPPKGLHDPVNGQYLDGDYDRVQGGNYTYTFRTRDTDEACELSSVTVTPSRYLIDHQGAPSSSAGTPVGFRANMLAANCNSLQCMLDGAAQYQIEWSTDDPAVLVLSDPSFGACLQQLPVTADKETAVGDTAALVADVRAIGGLLSTDGSSDVTVAFMDPVVTDKFPDCDEACVNAQIGADFNVPMDRDTLSAATIKLFRCRNASCNAPYADTDTPSIGTIEYATEGDATMGFRFGVLDDMQPGSFYKVILQGGTSGIMSASGVPLTGLNEGDSYVWTFHTKADGAPCQPSRSIVEPATMRMTYLFQRKDFLATPFGPPDSCEPSGQRLSSAQYGWDWNRSLSASVSGHQYEEFEQIFNGFLGNGDLYWGWFAQVSSPATLDTQIKKPAGCASDCRLIGSQIAKPQCGNARLEKGEACDKRDDLDPATDEKVFPDGCSPTTCLWTGTLGTADGGSCGNGSVDDGEECDAVASTFPPGCLEPTADQGGCLLLGSSAPSVNSRCGDALIGDGEACDDGNASNGDGCSRECLLEGSLPSCATVDTGAPCTNYCGNGIAEPGEDDACEGEGGPSVNGCDTSRCVLLGTSTCTSPDGVSCCGNYTVDPGEDAICESPDSNHPVPGCSDRCILMGSSYTYFIPSFCGDGVVGFGEAPLCEEGMGPDGKVDATQAYQAGVIEGADENGAVTVLTAEVADVSDDKAGTAEVTLACICNETGGSQACSGLASFPLSCNARGCCAPAPQVVQPTYPMNASNDICRNTEIRIAFDQSMDQASVEKNLYVGVYAPSGECPGGAIMPQIWHVDQQLSYGTDAAKQPIWRRAWNAVAGFFRSLFGNDAAAGATAPYPGNDATFCLVDGSVAVSQNVVTWSPAASLPADTWIHVAIAGGDYGATSLSTAPLWDSFEMYFGTGTEICTIDRVSVEPSVHLFTIADDMGDLSPGADDIDGDREFTARAHPKGQPADASIASTPEYAFKWNWDAQIDEPAARASVIDLVAETLSILGLNGYCEVGESANSPDCRIDLATIPEPKPAPGVGNDVCEPGEGIATESACAEKPGQEQIADVFVRRDGAGFPHDGEAVVRVTADIAQNRVIKTGISGTSEVTVLLCDHPWPARRTCAPDGNNVLRPFPRMPWDMAATCNVAGPYWSPFYDPATKISFYYCRDSGAGDAHDLLPALSEDLIFVQPGGNVLREYLFPSPNGDAIGLRIAANPEHRAVLDWYRRQGFLGAPGATTVDGYPAIQEGRTTYVGSAAVVPGNAIFTNVNVLSYSNDAEPETVAIYGQLLKNFDLNTNVSDLGYCTIGSQQALFDPDHQNDISPLYGYGYTTVQEMETGLDGNPVIKGAPANPVACSSDHDCWVNPTNGALLPEGFYSTVDDRPNYNDYRDYIRCAAPKGKLIRDVGRWGDMHSMRDSLLDAGVFPALEAGTFLRARTNSAWESWTSALGSAAGFTPPSDPVNAHAYCGAPSAFDPDSCWNATDKVYRCSAGSHVYAYRSIGGVAFSVAMDLETNCAAYLSQALCGTFSPVCTWSGSACVASAAWGGATPGTCLEYGTSASCGAALGGVCSNAPSKACSLALGAEQCGGAPCVSTCTWDPLGFCSYRYGQALLGGLAPAMSQCQDNYQGTGGICGDGILNGVNEQCEPNVPLAPTPCTAGSNPERTGVRQDSCSLSCAIVPGFCQVGTCGDGVVQSPERCDDGSVNGEYGKCAKDCGLSGACQSSPTCTGIGSRCGDGSIQPGEQCDCGRYNGSYLQNGFLQTPGVACRIPPAASPSYGGAGCAWDCRGAGPRCGDGIVNGSEQCDTETQTSRGYCDDSLKSPCATSEDCPLRPNSTAHHACGNIPAEPERSNVRACNTQASLGDSCEWGAWRLTEPGQCGNGVKETGEECDDTTEDSRYGDAGACVIDIGRRECKTNVCGDGYLNKAAGEQCDNGASENGKPCKPEYGIDCNYCSSSCKTVTLSGGFCGDGIVQSAGSNPVGPEQCEPTMSVPAEWICRSTWQGFRSWGLNIGAAGCEIETCRFYCPYPDADLCENTGGNFDKDGSTADLTVNFSRSFYDGRCSGNGSACNTDLSACPAGQTCNGFVWTPTGQVVTEGRIDNVLYDRCDYDKDGDGVPDQYDCDMLQTKTHQAYNFGSIVIPKAIEECDELDNDCDGHVDNSEPVDMIFLLDVSGTMGSYIDGIRGGIKNFVSTFRGGGHAFAIARIDMPTESADVAFRPGRYLTDPACPSRIPNDPLDPTDCFDPKVLDFTTNIGADGTDGTTKSGFLGALKDVTTHPPPAYGLERALDVLADTFYGNRMGFTWRANIHRRIYVVVTDAVGNSDTCKNGGTENTWCDRAECMANNGNDAAYCDSRITKENTAALVAWRKTEGFGGTVPRVETWIFSINDNTNHRYRKTGWESITGPNTWFTLSTSASTNEDNLKGTPNDDEKNPFDGVCAPPASAAVCGDNYCDPTSESVTYSECEHGYGIYPPPPLVECTADCGQNVC